MKTINKSIKLLVLAGIICFGWASAAFANFQTVGHTCTVTVPEVLSITADTSTIALNFSDWSTGAVSDTKTVVYTVNSNDMGQADGDTAINANLDYLYDRIDFKAKVGSYTKVGGNTELAAISSNYVTIGSSNTAIAKKANTTSSTDGKLLKGMLPITYQAVATANVPAGPQTHLMFITLTTR